jgi:hypothetical protein
MFYSMSASTLPTSRHTLLAIHPPSLKVNQRAAWKLAGIPVIALRDSALENRASGILVDVNYDEC